MKDRISIAIKFEEVNLFFVDKLQTREKNKIKIEIARWKKIIWLFNKYSGKI